eukprot:gene23593-31955_t
MSDEFNTDGRKFNHGSDKLFEALQKPDHTNEAIQFYNSSEEYVTTKDGSLVISVKAVKTKWTEWDQNNLKPIERTKNYTSGMVQSWNKFCFTGGVLQMAIRLPGRHDSGGLWPAAWLMGNLARATFEKSTMSMWPWSYDKCDGSISDLEAKQQISSCSPKPGFGLHPHQGRGAPEIDIFEVMPGHSMPATGPVEAFMSSSLQISPGLSKHNPKRPKNGQKLNSSQIWYENIHLGEGAEFNYGFWGQECGPEKDPSKYQIHKYMQDAVSVNRFLNETHFDSHHLYTLEWQPGIGGYLYWYLDDELILGIDGSSLEKLTGAMIPTEPMYLILNTAISHRWGMPEPCPWPSCGACWRCYDCTNPGMNCQCSLPDGMKNCRNLPAEMKVDFIRLYQDPQDNSHTIGCSPERFPTADFIASHSKRYEDWVALSPRSLAIYNTLFFTAMVACAVVLFVVLSRLLQWWRNYAAPVDREVDPEKEEQVELIVNSRFI